MKPSIYVVTPNRGLGELIRQTLEELGDYELVVAEKGATALKAAKARPPFLCILDLESDGTPPEAISSALREINPRLLLAAISPEGIAQTELKQLKADGYFSKPFYLPDFVREVEALLSAAESEGLSVPVPPKATPQAAEPVRERGQKEAAPPRWLEDVTLAAQHLTGLTLESASQAALIARGEQIWAYAGGLSQNAAEELASKVAFSWRESGGEDVVCSVHLEENGSEHMLYATGLGEEFILALVFDAETPMSRIKTQARYLADTFTAASPTILKDQTASASGPSQAAKATLGKPLTDVVGTPIPKDWQPEDAPTTKAFAQKPEEDDLPAFEPPHEPAKPAHTPIGSDAEPEERASFEGEDLAYQGEEVAPFTLEPVSPGIYDLVFTCLLIPRMPDHKLAGDLASYLYAWVGRLCLAFGWRLEDLNIKPNYMEWIVSVDPETSPGAVVKNIREHSSKRIFAEFPRLAEANPSGDFWAPGFLILSSKEPPPRRWVKELIQRIRKRQGLF